MRAVVLLSGGLDSYTAAAIAKADGFVLNALTIHYGQRHAREVQSARQVALALGVEQHKELTVDLRPIGGSSLTSEIDVPRDRDLNATDIPSTYVPARNTIFLSLALGWAEVIGARDLVVGVNALDYSGYPDCRPEFVRAFEALAERCHSRRRRRRALPHPHAAHPAVESRHHSSRHCAWAGLRPDAQLLRSGALRTPVRTLRQLCSSRERLCRGGRGRPVASALRSRGILEVSQQTTHPSAGDLRGRGAGPAPRRHDCLVRHPDARRARRRGPRRSRFDCDRRRRRVQRVLHEPRRECVDAAAPSCRARARRRRLQTAVRSHPARSAAAERRAAARGRRSSRGHGRRAAGRRSLRPRRSFFRSSERAVRPSAS